MTIKYQIIENKNVQSEFGNCFDVCNNRMKLIRRFNHKSNAEEYAQMLVEDDQWNAMNR